jgi:hypothetical protein
VLRSIVSVLVPFQTKNFLSMHKIPLPYSRVTIMFRLTSNLTFGLFSECLFNNSGQYRGVT